MACDGCPLFLKVRRGRECVVPHIRFVEKSTLYPDETEHVDFTSSGISKQNQIRRFILCAAISERISDITTQCMTVHYVPRSNMRSHQYKLGWLAARVHE